MLYFVAIVAPDDINRQVLEWKNYMLQRFQCKVALKSPAHITLIPPFDMPNAISLLRYNGHAWEIAGTFPLTS